jgi:pyridoxal phosphate enzyme (YggS family)
MSVAERLHKINERISTACVRSGRSPSDVHLLAVSKLQPLARIQEAWQSGQKDFAENYAQEALLKQEQIPGARWHFIGRIQSNKVKFLANRFAIIHSVDRFSLAHNLDRLNEGGPQEIFIQYNVAEEPSKGGANELELENLVRGVSALENLRMLGLMVMPPVATDAERSRPFFRQACEMLAQLRGGFSAEILRRHPLNQLSMGTSHDFEVAIEEGATWIRVGTDVFGARASEELQ